MSQQAEQGKFELFDASSYKVAIVSAQFNMDICEALIASALEMGGRYSIKHIPIYRVPGSVEIPVILKSLAKTKQYDCLVALGVVIRGETPHFEFVAKMVTEGISRVMLDYGIPIGFGVLTCENQDQAVARVYAGAGAMQAALECAKIIMSV